mgnify:CR=1 FL=1
MKFRPNAPLLIGIGLPVLMVILVGASIYLPGMFAKKPAHNFVYSVPANSYSYYGPGSAAYAVENGMLVEKPTPNSVQAEMAQTGVAPTKPSLYLHDVAANKSRAITFDEAAALSLDGNNESADGFSVINGGYGGGFFPIFGLSDSGGQKYYLKKGNYSRELNLSQNSSNRYDYHMFQFIGWVN